MKDLYIDLMNKYGDFGKRDPNELASMYLEELRATTYFCKNCDKTWKHSFKRKNNNICLTCLKPSSETVIIKNKEDGD